MKLRGSLLGILGILACSRSQDAATVGADSARRQSPVLAGSTIVVIPSPVDSGTRVAGAFAPDTEVVANGYQLQYLEFGLTSTLQFVLVGSEDSVITLLCSGTTITRDTLQLRCDGSVLGPVAIGGRFVSDKGHFGDAGIKSEDLAIEGAISIGQPARRWVLDFTFVPGE